MNGQKGKECVVISLIGLGLDRPALFTSFSPQVCGGINAQYLLIKCFTDRCTKSEN